MDWYGRKPSRATAANRFCTKDVLLVRSAAMLIDILNQHRGNLSHERFCVGMSEDGEKREQASSCKQFVLHDRNPFLKLILCFWHLSYRTTQIGNERTSSLRRAENYLSNRIDNI